MNLADSLLDPAKRPLVVTTLVDVIDAEVSRKSGLGGMLLKGAYGTAKGVSGNFLSNAVDAMLPELADVLQPYWDDKGERGLGQRLTADKAVVADRILAIADAKADRVDNAALLKVYRSVRGKAKGHVEEALPALGAAVERLAS